MWRHRLAFLALLFSLSSVEAKAGSVGSSIVVDADAGTVISDHNSNEPWYPASVTKLMTAYLAFSAVKSGSLTLASPVTESQNAQNEPASKMGFKVGTVMNLDNALKMMLVHSANDIAVAIAEAVGGSEPAFITLMNSEAHRLGMNSTHFRNPNGLPAEGHVTTARDLAVLARALWVDFPQYRDYLNIPAIRAGEHVLRSQNTLLERYEGANGMKTGFICASGFNMVVSATRVGHTLIAVVLGADSSADRAEATAQLLNDAFSKWAFGIGRPKLASFEGEAVSGAPTDMRDKVCGKHKQQEAEDTSDTGGADTAPALGPRLVSIDPVPVYTMTVPATPDVVATKKPSTAKAVAKAPGKAQAGKKVVKAPTKAKPKDLPPADASAAPAEGDASPAASAAGQ